MSCPTVLPATDFSELLGRRVPVVAAPLGDATVVNGVGWDANGGPVWQACLGVQWHSAQTRPCAKRPWVLAQSRSAWQALHAQEAGAAAVVVPADELPTALAVLGIPVVADGLADGRSLVQALDQGAHGGCLAAAAQPLAHVLAEANRLWPMFAASSAELASPVCYAPEFERERNAPLVAQLNAVLAQERTLARAAVHIPQLGADHLRTTLAACAALRQSVRALEAVACTRSLDWYTAVRHAPASDRLALWQAQWQQVQNQWEKMAKTLIPLMDNASVLESVYAQRSLALRPPPAGADGGIERQHRSIGRADCA